MQKVLYRERRPEILDEVLGQEHIVKILKNQIETNTIAHAYLLSGIRGTGKTTVARLIAKAVNCTNENNKPCGTCQNCVDIAAGNFIDVIEIDAASNGGIDNIRQIKENANLIPMAAAKKVYIIDEAHMISKDAANAFLKVLEEPPEHVHFILATTDPQALIVTILSRCMRLDFRRISDKVIMENIAKICADKGIHIDDEAAAIITANADGSARDSLSLLQQCISSGLTNISPEYVLEILGGLQIANYIEMTKAILNSDIAKLLMMLDNFIFEGKDVRQIMRDWLTHYRNLLITKFSNNPEIILSTTAENIARIKAQSEITNLDTIEKGIEVLVKAINDAKHTNSPKIILEMAVISLALQRENPDVIHSVPQPVETKRDEIIEKKNNPEQPVSVDQLNNPSPPDIIAQENDTEHPADIQKDNQNECPEDSVYTFDLNSLWDKILTEAKATTPMLAILGPTTKLIKIDDNHYTIKCTSVSAEIIDDYTKLFDELIQKHTGKKLKAKYDS